MLGAMWGTIRKFGLDHCDLPTMIWNISVMLRALTLNVDNRYKKRIPIVFYILTFVCAVNFYYSYLFSMLWFLFVRSPQTGDLPAAMVVMSLGVCSEIATLRLMFMFSQVKRIRRVVAEYLKFDARTIPGSRFSRNLIKELKEVKKRAIGFWLLIMVNGVIYVILPTFLPGRHLQEDLYIIYGLEPMLESPNYEIAYFLTSCCCLFISYISANITSFIIIIVGYTEAQMLSFSEELINVWDDAIQETHSTIELKIGQNTNRQYTTIQHSRIVFDDDMIKKINIEVKKRLIYLIQNHSRNISLIGEVESIFRISIAVGFVFVVIGLIAELLGGLENTFLVASFTISQLVIDCWIGQWLIDASNIFAQAVYDCKWENFDRHNRKIVLVILQVSQKTLTLSAGGMTMLSLSLLMSILRSIYSAYTTLRSMM